jgi:hypothetical protein
MTRTERINKLGRSIKRMRGLHDPATGKWITPPDKNACAAVVKWLLSLGVENPKGLIDEIFAFKTIDDFRAFMKNLGEPVQ